MTRQEWLTGNIPVVYYPAKAIETATFKVDESYPDEAILEVALLPKESAKVKPQIFFIGLKKDGAAARGGSNYWVPRAAPAGPERPRLDRLRVAGRLSSPRFRRRALKVGLLLAVGRGGRAREHLLLEHGHDRRDAAPREGRPLRAADPDQDGAGRAACGDRHRRALRRDRSAARARRAGLRARRAEPARDHDARRVAHGRHPGRAVSGRRRALEVRLLVRERDRAPGRGLPAAGRGGATGRLQPVAPLRRCGCEAALARRLVVAAREAAAARGRAAPTARRSGSTSRRSRARRPASAPSGCSCPRRWSRWRSSCRPRCS